MLLQEEFGSVFTQLPQLLLAHHSRSLAPAWLPSDGLHSDLLKSSLYCRAPNWTRYSRCDLKCHTEGKNHFPWPGSYAFAKRAQLAVGLCGQGTLLIDVQPAASQTIRPFSAQLLPSNSSVLLYGGYSTPNTGLYIFLSLNFTRFLSVHLSLGPTEQRPCPPAYSPLPQAAIICSTPNETEQKHDNLEWPSPCCCSRRETQVGRGVQENHYWFSVFFVRLRAYRSQASPL